MANDKDIKIKGNVDIDIQDQKVQKLAKELEAIQIGLSSIVKNTIGDDNFSQMAESAKAFENILNSIIARRDVLNKAMSKNGLNSNNYIEYEKEANALAKAEDALMVAYKKRIQLERKTDKGTSYKTSFQMQSFQNKNGEQVDYPVMSNSDLTGISFKNGTRVKAGQQISTKQFIELYEKAQEDNNKESIKVLEDVLKEIIERINSQQNNLSVEEEKLLNYFSASFSKKKTLTPRLQQWQSAFKQAKSVAKSERGRNYYSKKRMQDAPMAGEWQETNDPEESKRKASLEEYRKPIMQSFEDETDDYIEEWLKRNGVKQSRNKKFSIREQAQRIEEQAKAEAEARRQAGEENVNDYGFDEVELAIKNVLRFVYEGETLTNVDGIYAGLDSDTQVILAQLKLLSDKIQSRDFFGKFLNNEMTQEEANQLTPELIKFLEQLQSFFIREYESSYDPQQGDDKYTNRLKMRIFELSKILGNVVTETVQDENGKDVVKTSLDSKYVDTFWQDIIGGKIGNATFSGRAKRSLLSKQGVVVQGKYPIGIEEWGGLPQFMGGAIPGFPVSKERSEELKTQEGRLGLLFKYLKEYENKYNLLDQGDQAITDAGYTYDSLNEYIYQIEDIMSTIFGTLDKETQIRGEKLLNKAGYGFNADNNISRIDNFSTVDWLSNFERVQEEYEGYSDAQLKQIIDYFKNLLETRVLNSGPDISADVEKSDYKEVIDSLKFLLNNFSESAFNEQDLQRYWEDNVELEALPLDEFRYKKNKKGNKTISRSQIKQILAKYQKEYDAVQRGGESPLDIPINELLNILELEQKERAQSEEDKALDTEIEENIKKYMQSSNGQKAKITKDFNKKYSGNEKAKNKWKEAIAKAKQERDAKAAEIMRSSQELQKNAEEQAQKAQEQIQDVSEQEKETAKVLSEKAEEVKNNTPEPPIAPQAKKAGLYNVKNVQGNYVGEMTRIFKDGGKEYTGPGIMFNGTPSFVGADIQQMYEKATLEQRETILKQLREVFDSLDTDKQEWFTNELNRSKKGIGDTLVQDWNNAFKQEEKAIQNVNETLSEHEEKVENAVEAESQKIIISEKLAEALKEEKKATDNATDAVTDHVEELVKVDESTFKPIDVQFHDKDSKGNPAHYYTTVNSNGQQEFVMSATQLRSKLMNKEDPSFQSTIDYINNALNATPKGNVVTADSLGMDQKDFDFYAKGFVGKGFRGTLFHSAIEALSKSQFSGNIDDLEKNWKQILQNNSELAEQYENLAKLGLNDDNFVHLEQSLMGYFDAVRKSGMTFSNFSEQALGFELGGNKGTFKVAVTPDQLMNYQDELGVNRSAVVDNKRSAMRGYESFQLTLEKMGMLANKNNPAFASLFQGSDVTDDMKLYVANVEDGKTQLVEFASLTMQEIYELLVKAQDGVKLTDEEINYIKSKQLKFGKYTGSSSVPATNADDWGRKPDQETVFKGDTAQEVSDNFNNSNKIDEIANYNTAIAQYQKAQQEIIKLTGQAQELDAIKLANEKRISELKKIGTTTAKEEISDLTRQNELLSAKRETIDANIKTQQVLKDSTQVEDYMTGRSNKGILPSEIMSKLKSNEIKNQNAMEAQESTAKANAEEKVSIQLQERKNSLIDKYISIYEQYLKLKSEIHKLETSDDTTEKGKEQLAIAQEKSNELKKQIDLYDSYMSSGSIDGIVLTNDDQSRIQENVQRLQVEKNQRDRLINAGSMDSANNSEKKRQENVIKEYKTALNKQFSYERDIAKLRKSMEGQSGEQLRDSETQLAVLQRQLGIYTQITNGYDRGSKTLNGIKLTDEQILQLEKYIANAQGEQDVKLSKINTEYRKQQGLISQIFGGFRNAFRNITDASLAYAIINQVKSGIREVIAATKELDAALVDIQIATGNTRNETKQLLIEYSDLADELGRTTQSVATASNDWLRAGYQGKEAAELTRASMMLSTLGMIDASDATTYLISTLKGWKIQANEVIDVVDKLTAVDMAAAISAGDLALAMSRANASARLAGSDMDKFIGYVTTVADVTQKSAESVGESFKTIYSRFGNVKAGKFVASQEEMNSSNYNEEEFESLNDIETVLSSIGIKLRENAKEWRDIDDVLQDIADSWDNWDQTTKNAVATAVAGTRQRENVLQLFSNWDEVDKYAEIAANSYGTATEKMEAYTDSVEASQQRIKVAIEKWALYFDGSDVMKTFYDSIGYVIENLHILAATIMAVAMVTKGDEIASVFSGGIAKLGVKLSDFGMFKNYNGMDSETREYYKNKRKQERQKFMEDDWVYSQQQMFQKRFNMVTKESGMSPEAIGRAKDMQKAVLGLSPDNKIELAKNLRGEKNSFGFGTGAGITYTYNPETKQMEKVVNSYMDSLEAQNLATILLTKETDKTKKGLLERIKNGELLNLSDNELKEANKILTEARKDAAVQEMADEAELSSRMGTYKDAQLKGALSLVGAGAGGFGVGSVLGNALSGIEVLGQDLGPVGEILGGTLGASMGSSAGEAVFNGIKEALTVKAAQGTMKQIIGGFFTGAGALGIAGLVVTALTAAWGVYNMWQEAQVKKAQEAFKEAEEKFSNAKGSNVTAKQFDELAKGVDSFGNNLTLTDDEYQSFLDKSNELAELFPELVVRTDEAGNKLVGIGNIVGGVTEKVADLNRELQHQADEKLLDKYISGEAFNDSYSQIKDLQNKINAINLGDTNALKEVYDKYNVKYETLGYGDDLIISSVEDAQQATNARANMIQDYENQINSLKKTMENYSQASVRELGYVDEAFQSQLDSMSDAEQTVYQELISNIDYRKTNSDGSYQYDWKGNYKMKSDEEINQEIRDITNQVDTAFEKLGEENIEIAFKKPSDYETLEEMQKARQQLMDALMSIFGADGVIDDTEAQIIIGLGFEVKDNSITDPQDILNNFRELGVAEKIGIGNDAITVRKLSSLSPEDAKSAFELMNSGIVKVTGSWQTLLNLINSDKGPVETVEGYSQYFQMLLAQEEGFQDEFNKVIDSKRENKNIKMSAGYILTGMTDEEIDESFSQYNSSIRGGIKNAKKNYERNVKEYGKSVEEANQILQKELDGLFNASKFNTLNEQLKLQLSLDFSGVDLGDDGLVNSFSELKDVLDSLSDSFDRLKEAQNEYNTTGKLSMQTVLDLISTDQNYLNVLDLSGDTIKLRDDAEQTLMNSKINTAKASILQMRNELLLESQQIQNALTSDDLVAANEILQQSSADSITKNNALTNSLVQQSNAALAAARGLQAKNKAEEGATDTKADENAAIVYQGKAGRNDTIKAPDSGDAKKSKKLDANTREKLLAKYEQNTGISRGDAFVIGRDGQVLASKIDLNQDKYLNGGGFSFGGSIGALDKLYGMDTWDNFQKKYKTPDTKDTKDSKYDPMTQLEKLKKLASLIDKEYEAMVAKDRDTYTEYFKKMGDNLAEQKKAVLEEIVLLSAELEKLTPGTEEYDKKYSELNERQTDLIDIEKKIANLDDEEVEDKKKNLETMGATLAMQIAAQRELIKASDTEEELIERQKALNDLLKQEQETRKNIRDYQKELIDTELEYESGTPNSNRYNELINQKQALYAEDMVKARLAIQDARNEAYQSFKKSQDMYDDFGNAKYTDDELWDLANNSEKVQEAVKNYIEAFQSAAELSMKVVEDQISSLDKKLDKLENRRPNEWTSRSDINRYYNDRIDLLQDKIDIWEEALEDTSNLTDEQITSLVESINDATKSIQEAKIARREDIKAYDDKYYEAITWQVNQYIDEIELAKKVNDDWYDDAIKKLQDYNDDLDRTNKLLELQKNLKNSMQEKERVYRQGIGWVNFVRP